MALHLFQFQTTSINVAGILNLVTNLFSGLKFPPVCIFFPDKINLLFYLPELIFVS